MISFVTISGFVQGMLLPLLAIILEQNGVSSTVNGLHATSLYIGVLIASPFMEQPLQRFGYKPIILTGGLLVICALALFPVSQSLWLWFLLRLIIGIGDQMLSFATQTWVTSTTKTEKRGKTIALYGLFFSLGFAIGPLMTRLLYVHEHLPFLLASLLCLVVWSMMLFVQNEQVTSDQLIITVNIAATFKRFVTATKLAWIALMGPFAYGVLEALLHGIFPIYGLRIGHPIDTISIIIPLFSITTLLTQVPLGALSDRIGRQKTLCLVTSSGIITFFLAAQFEQNIAILIMTFTAAGMLLGSLYSMGVSFMTDLLPKSLLPAGNIMCGISFSVGSITAPYLGGLFIELFPAWSFFYSIVFILSIITVLFLTQKKHASEPAK